MMTQKDYTPTHETVWMEFPYYSYQEYKIEIVNDRLAPMQRHLFKRKDGEIETQEWINGIYSKDTNADGFAPICGTTN